MHQLVEVVHQTYSVTQTCCLVLFAEKCHNAEIIGFFLFFFFLAILRRLPSSIQAIRVYVV